MDLCLIMVKSFDSVDSFRMVPGKGLEATVQDKAGSWLVTKR